MVQRYGRRLAVMAVLALALVLSGCSNSKKGNGYGYAPLAHPAPPAHTVIAAG